jgi:hypothetical protein
VRSLLKVGGRIGKGALEGDGIPCILDLAQEEVGSITGRVWG